MARRLGAPPDQLSDVWRAQMHWPRYLVAYALGALEPDEAEAVREHVARCDECKAELASFERIADGLPSAMAAASPPRIHRSLQRRIVAGVQVRPARRLLPRALLLPAVAVLAIVLFLASSLYTLSLRRQLAEDQVLSSRRWRRCRRG